MPANPDEGVEVGFSCGKNVVKELCIQTRHSGGIIPKHSSRSTIVGGLRKASSPFLG